MDKLVKLYLIRIPSSPVLNPLGYVWYQFNPHELFTVGKIYEGDICPTIIDPETLRPAPISYIVKCDDGKCVKVGGEYFITLEEWREQQLDKIL